jgi:hypothetical protein
MKRIIVLLMLAFVSNYLLAQKINLDSLPKGVIFKEGKLKVEKGYSIKLSKDRKTATIVTTKGRVVVGALKCECRFASNCKWVKILQPADSTIGCMGGDCCAVSIMKELPKESRAIKTL